MQGRMALLIWEGWTTSKDVSGVGASIFIIRIFSFFFFYVAEPVTSTSSVLNAIRMTLYKMLVRLCLWIVIALLSELGADAESTNWVAWGISAGVVEWGSFRYSFPFTTAKS
jgi:hypothetical protein